VLTDATGKSFLSYKSSRRAEAESLIAAQHDHGIPTWRDRTDLDEVPTADELRRVLDDRFTSNAVLLITPEVATSDIIRRIEVPGILRRIDARDEYFLLPVCAGRLDYEAAAQAVDEHLTAENLKNWNLYKVACDPLTRTEAAGVAQRVLKRRIAAVNRQLEPDLPLRLLLHTRTYPVFQPGVALSLNWCDRFVDREAIPGAWNDLLLPALSEVSRTVRSGAAGRLVVAGGLASIPSVTALGAAFLAPAGLKLAWNQYTPGRADQLWGLNAVREPAGFVGNTRDQDVSGTDLAVFISVTDDVEPAFAQTPKSSLPSFRAITRIAKPDCHRFDITTPGQAVDVAHTVIEAIRAARRDFRPIMSIHLFAAVPLGVAMMVGQLLNTFGPVQTYEHIPVDGTGIYKPAALLKPSP
jgi:SMODS-associated and fused to various effectors sensor domain